MANLKEKKNFVGGLDKGSDERYLKEGDYFDALNIRNQSSETNSNGMIQNIKGTTKKSYTYPTGKPVILHGIDSFADITDISFNDASHTATREHTSHGETVPKTVVYFLPSSISERLFLLNFLLQKELMILAEALQKLLHINLLENHYQCKIL